MVGLYFFCMYERVNCFLLIEVESRVMMQYLCDIKTLERNTIFLSEPNYPYKSDTNTPTSTSTSATATENETLTLADEVKKYDTAGLISFLRGRDLRLDEDDEKIIRN